MTPLSPARKSTAISSQNRAAFFSRIYLFSNCTFMRISIIYTHFQTAIARTVSPSRVAIYLAAVSAKRKCKYRRAEMAGKNGTVTVKRKTTNFLRIYRTEYSSITFFLYLLHPETHGNIMPICQTSKYTLWKTIKYIETYIHYILRLKVLTIFCESIFCSSNRKKSLDKKALIAKLSYIQCSDFQNETPIPPRTTFFPRKNFGFGPNSVISSFRSEIE